MNPLQLGPWASHAGLHWPVMPVGHTHTKARSGRSHCSFPGSPGNPMGKAKAGGGGSARPALSPREGPAPQDQVSRRGFWEALDTPQRRQGSPEVLPEASVQRRNEAWASEADGARLEIQLPWAKCLNIFEPPFPLVKMPTSQRQKAQRTSRSSVFSGRAYRRHSISSKSLSSSSSLGQAFPLLRSSCQLTTQGGWRSEVTPQAPRPPLW